MLRKEQNDLLTQTGPGTPMGQLFRSYWMPALLAEELPENDCPPVRVKILSERLLAFRDSDGKLWPDRRVLRPPRRVAVVRAQRGRRPALPLSRLEIRRDRPVHRRAVRAGGERLLPEDQAEVLSAGRSAARCCGPIWARRRSSRRCRNGSSPPCPPSRRSSPSACRNATGCRRWRAASIPATSPSCIAAISSSDPLFKGAKGNEYNLADMRPHFEVVEQPGGLYIGARRNAENGNYYWRITPWVMPCFTMIPPRGDHPIHGHFWIPIDDENCWAWSYDFHPVRPLTEREVDAMQRRRRRALQVHAGHLSAARQQGQRLSDGPRRAEGRQDLQRRCRLRHAGCVAAGEHGADLRPHQGEPGLDRQRHHHGAPPPDARRQGAGRQGHRRRPASIPRTSGCARPRWCCRRTRRSRMPPRRRSPRPGVAQTTV